MVLVGPVFLLFIYKEVIMCVCGVGSAVFTFWIQRPQSTSGKQNKTKLKNLKENPSHADDMIDDLAWLFSFFSKKVFYFNFF